MAAKPSQVYFIPRSPRGSDDAKATGRGHPTPIYQTVYSHPRRKGIVRVYRDEPSAWDGDPTQKRNAVYALGVLEFREESMGNAG
jgi:hypothetical protein